MPTASKTVPGDAGSVTVQVPAGPARKVEVYAVPDWAATQEIYVETYLPTLAKAYGGTVIVDVAGGQKVPVSMDMDVVETKILLPGQSGFSLVAQSLQGPVDDPGGFPWLSSDSDFEFDRFGRVYITDNSWIMSRFSDLNGDDIEYNLAPAPSRLAYDKRNERMYYLNYGDLWYLDLRNDFYDIINNATAITFQGNGLAVDDEGYVYISAYDESLDDGEIIAKLLIFDNGEVLEAQLVDYATYESLGLRDWYDDMEGYLVFGILPVEDMRFQEGLLYIAAGDHGNEYESQHHGKIVAVDTSDLTKVREIGWAQADWETPIPDPTKQFYGPMRFLAIVPRKLIFADQGYEGNLESEIDRVVELDLDTWSISGIGLDGEVSFPFLSVC